MAVTSVREKSANDRLSPEFLHWASGNYASGRGSLSAAAAALERDGHPPNDQWPYDPSIDDANASYGPPQEVIGPYRKGRINEYLSDVDEIIDALEKGDWAVVILGVTDLFGAAGTQVVLPDGPGHALHAVVAVAAARITTDLFLPTLARGDRMLCLRNSWGTGWGSHGHKLITEAALQQCMTAAFSLADPPPMATP